MAKTLRTNDLKTLGQDALNSAHQLWLAGLGVVAATQEEASSLFERLVERGKELEARGSKQLRQVRSRATSAYEDATQAAERRLAATLHRFGVPTRQDIRDLTRRVEELSKTVGRWGGPEPKPRATA